MITEVDKYRAQYFQIVGISFSAPFAKLVLDIFDLKFEKLTSTLALLLGLSLLLVFVGIILVMIGERFLKK